jgi:ketosteroid isomerase-like protein
MKNSLLMFTMVALLFTACAPNTISTSNRAESANAEIRKIMDEQSICWSKGDLECFMQGYWKSDSLLFVGSRGLTYGWQQTLDNYKQSYPDASAMGKLTFNLKEMKELSPETILVVGKWHLQREASKGDVEGHFSVIFKQFKDGWKIIADHSS